MTIKPLGKPILAQKIGCESKKTSGGIVLPDTVKSNTIVRAKVLAIGTDEKFEVKVGDEIFVDGGFNKLTEIEQGEDKLILVKESDVLAIVEN